MCLQCSWWIYALKQPNYFMVPWHLQIFITRHTHIHSTALSWTCINVPFEWSYHKRKPTTSHDWFCFRTTNCQTCLLVLSHSLFHSFEGKYAKMPDQPSWNSSFEYNLMLKRYLQTIICRNMVATTFLLTLVWFMTAWLVPWLLPDFLWVREKE